MKIIKVNEGNEKVKYEIYNMYLNQEIARRYREEQAKKLEFYRLEFDDDYDLFRNNGLGLTECIQLIGKRNAKYVYEFTEIPVEEKCVVYGDFGDIISPQYSFRPYDTKALYSNYYKKEKEKGLAQQKDFINYFVEEGLSDYQFEHLDRTGYSMHAYIFLNSFGLHSSHSAYCYTDNVVWLPNEMITMYLLEKGYVEEMHYYISKIDYEEEKKIFASFDFEKSSTFTEQQMKDLLNSGLVEEEAFTRKISLDKYITNYIK